jgi:tRNA dimethylallyltransferase
VGDKDRLNKVLVVVGGPTASGKTEVAIQLARHYHTEIVNADSRQLYIELNIGVGKPSADQMKAVPHHLISHTTIHHPYSAGHYTTDAFTVIDTLFARHDIVIVCGGSGLYIKSITEGFDEIPEVPEKLIGKWTQIWEAYGNAPLLSALKEMDPDYLDIVDRDNPSRLLRAVCVSDFSGRPFSSFRKGEKSGLPYQQVLIAMDLPRKELYARIDRRVVEMIKNGWLEEAKDLFPHRGLKALQTVGYKELFEVLDGNMTIEEAIPAIQQSTRRYAKRQTTWFRHQGAWLWIHPDNFEEMYTAIDAALERS